MGICSDLIGKEKPSTLYFLFASQGGSVDAGVTLYNFLKSLPVKIIMHNVGSIDSIANVIFVAGKERYASPHSTFLFHGVNIDVPIGASFGLAQLNEITDRIKKNHATIAGIICDNTKLDIKEIEALFLEGETKNVDFALKKGLINEVKPAEVPQNAPFVSINVNG